MALHLVTKVKAIPCKFIRIFLQGSPGPGAAPWLDLEPPGDKNFKLYRDGIRNPDETNDYWVEADTIGTWYNPPDPRMAKQVNLYPNLPRFCGLDECATVRIYYSGSYTTDLLVWNKAAVNNETFYVDVAPRASGPDKGCIVFDVIERTEDPIPGGPAPSPAYGWAITANDATTFGVYWGKDWQCRPMCLTQKPPPPKTEGPQGDLEPVGGGGGGGSEPCAS